MPFYTFFTQFAICTGTDCKWNGIRIRRKRLGGSWQLRDLSGTWTSVLKNVVWRLAKQFWIKGADERRPERRCLLMSESSSGNSPSDVTLQADVASPCCCEPDLHWSSVPTLSLSSYPLLSVAIAFIILCYKPERSRVRYPMRRMIFFFLFNLPNPADRSRPWGLPRNEYQKQKNNASGE
jgi:hypothetical protein